MTNTTAATNRYVTVRIPRTVNFWVNEINYDGTIYRLGTHPYIHKRSARRAATALAKKLDVNYRQDLEYTHEPHAFLAKKRVTT